MTKILSIVGLSLLLAVALPLTGCKSTLEPGGAYSPNTTNAVGVVETQPDKPLLAADSSFHLAYTVLDTTFKIERDNRAALRKVSPDIKRNLDLIRPRAVAARDSYFRMRAVYLSARTDSRLADLKSALANVESLSSEARTLLPK